MVWKARGPTRSLACISSGCRKIESAVLHSMRRRDSGSYAFARCRRLEGINSKKARAEVLLGCGRLHTGITAFALDRHNCSSFRTIHATTTDEADIPNLAHFY